MLDPFDSITNWATGTADTANLALNNTTLTQGTGSVEFDKTGTASAQASIVKRLPVTIDIQSLQDTIPGATVKMRFRHANFTNFAAVFVVFEYRQSLSVYDRFDFSGGFSAGAWNTLSVALASPSFTSGTPTKEHRSHCIAIYVYAQMNDVANTFSDLLVDALEIVGTAGQPQPGCLIFDDERLLTPPLDIWNMNPQEQTLINSAPGAMSTMFLERYQSIEFGLLQVRAVHRPQSKIHSLEESLRRFAQYAAANQGWGLAFPAGELIDTTLSSAASERDSTISVASATEFSFLGLTASLEAGYADLRLGPNSAREVEFVRAIAISGTTVTLDRPLKYAHASGATVRSAGYYPSLGKLESGHAVQASDRAVSFRVKARETT